MSNITIVELLPCAHCGGQVLKTYVDFGNYLYIQCECGATISRWNCDSSLAELKAAWNRRTPVPENIKLESA